MTFEISMPKAPANNAKPRGWLNLLKPPLGALSSILFLLVFLYVETHAEISILSIAFMFLLVGYIGLLAYYAVGCVWHFVCFQLFSAASMLLAVAVLALGLLCGRQLTDFAFYYIDLTRLNFAKAHYESLITQQSHEQKQQKILVFDWGSGGLLGTNFFYSLVYDGESLFSLGSQDQNKIGSRLAELHPGATSNHCRTSTRHLTGKFYSVSIVCQ